MKPTKYSDLIALAATITDREPAINEYNLLADLAEELVLDCDWSMIDDVCKKLKTN